MRLILGLMLLCALLCLGLPAFCVPAPLDRTPISSAAQDSSGQVWGASGFGYQAPQEGLHQWQKDGWQAVALPFAQGYSAFAVASGSDGRVYCVWQSESKPESLLTVHHGSDSRLVARFPGNFERGVNGYEFAPTIFPDAGGGAWVMGQRSILWHVSLNGRVRAFPLPSRWFYPKRMPQSGNEYYLLTLSATDGQGRRWFWSDDLTSVDGSACLRGVLVWDGKTLTERPTLPGVPDKPFTTIAPKDAEHFWLAVDDVGLYEVDTKTMQGRRVPPPEKGAFQGVEKIFRAGSDWYLTDWDNQTKNERSVTLWRLHGGQWQKASPGLDKTATYFIQQDRPWLATASGLWVGAYGGGAWWLPSGAKTARPVDWRRGFPLSGVNDLFRLRSGRLLAVKDGSVLVSPDPPPSLPMPIPIQTFLTSYNLTALTADSRHHLWGLLAADPDFFREWDGATWRKHRITKKVPLEKSSVYAWDTENRIWILPFDLSGSAAIFNPKTDGWAVFASCEAAFAAQAGANGFGLRPDVPQPMPRFGSGGRICFLSEEDTVHFFDGHWKQWKVASIAGQAEQSDGPPFFNAAGNLSLNVGKRSWEWTPGAGWHFDADYEAGPDDVDRSNPRYVPRTVPPGSPTDRPEAYIQDGPNLTWETYNRQLYKVAFGLSAPQFAPGTANPFGDGRYLNSVLRDSRGNTFLSTDAAEQIFLPAAVPPETHLAVTAEGADEARLEMTTTADGPHWFVWRLDGGAWSAATRAGSIPLNFLPGGPHIAEAIALDARLNFDPTPAKAAFTVQADPQAQVRALIGTLLTGDDNAREAAVTRLLQFPALAPPALKAARPAADDAARWWIDAALGQIEEAAQKPQEKP